MSSVLLLLSSPRGAASHSSKVARELAARWLARHPGSRLTVRDLAHEPLPHIGEAYVTGRKLPESQRTLQQQAAVAISDRLINELHSHEVLIVASSMINFSMSSTLKAWFDYVLRSGVTFRYEDGSPVGMVLGKRVYLVQARGADYSQAPYQANDFQQPLIRVLLGYMGMTICKTFNIEGVAFGAEAAEQNVLNQVATLPELT
ncbi:FMN-dependent NADH-azoreductase [Pseudomonas corrugata]|nr:NAD(P)H-dependent oxidoreductase [Pseudomonas corrugata]NUT64710.1 FMN-dependent NADH-azoreductase [Pseudomonas corrugata]